MLRTGPQRSRFVRRTAALTPLAVLAGLLVAPATPAQAAPWHSYAYVHADKPDLSVGTWYTATGPRKYNSSGDVIRIRKEQTGRYHVELRGLATEPTDNLGVAHVTAYGDSATYCSVGSTSRVWTLDPKTGAVTYTGIGISVHCFDESDNLVDSEFTASWTSATGAGGVSGDFAYLTSRFVDSSHEPAADRRYNSVGEKNTVTWLDTGRYQVTLNGLGNKGFDPKDEKGHVQVTAYLLESTRCKVANFFTHPDSTQINVNCHDWRGKPSNSLFTLTYTRDTSLVWSPWGAYTWVQGTEVYPDEQWTYPDVAHVTLGGGTEEGRYWVSTSLDGFMVSGNVQVTAQGPGAHHCKVVAWDTDKGIQVRCFDYKGKSIRNAFFVSYAL